MKKLTLRRQHLINVYCIIIYQINSRDGNNYTNVTHVCVMVCPSPYSMNMDRLLLFDILHTILEQARVMVRPCPYMIFTINDNLITLTHSKVQTWTDSNLKERQCGPCMGLYFRSIHLEEEESEPFPVGACLNKIKKSTRSDINVRLYSRSHKDKSSCLITCILE